jgi:eukaryotic-like serine/threonine-protein kinase
MPTQVPPSLESRSPEPRSSETLSPPTGRRVRFLELLGQGGFGAVYRAEVRADNGMVQHMAVKVLSLDMSAQPDLAARQRDEARLLARLRHHAIVSVFDLTELGGRPAVLMELVEGVDASELRASAALTPRASMQIVAETAGALDAAWSTPDPDSGRPLRVVHRDIKPANLLVSRHGGVKVLDFGVARAEFDREGVTGSVQFGTARYMAPEQWMSGTASHPVDVYALGVSLVELLTGAALPRAPLAPERFRAHIEDAAEAATRAAGGDPAVRRLIKGMLAYSPDARLSAAQVREAALTLSDTLPGAQLARLAPRVVPELMAARKARLAGRMLPGSLPMGADPGGTPPPVDPAAPPSLPQHLQQAQAARPQTPSERHRTLPPDDSGLTMALSDPTPAPPRAETAPRRQPALVAGVAVALAVMVLGLGAVWGLRGETSGGTDEVDVSRQEGPSERAGPGADGSPAGAPGAPTGTDPTSERTDAGAVASAGPAEPAAPGPSAARAQETAAGSPPAPGSRGHADGSRPAVKTRRVAPSQPTPTATDPVSPPTTALNPQPSTAPAPAPAPDAAEAPAHAQSEPPAVSPAAAPAPLALHAVTLSSDPLGAHVWVDGADLGTTPVVGAALREGDHAVRMVLGTAQIEGTIRVRRMRPVSEVKWRVESGRLSMQ